VAFASNVIFMDEPTAALGVVQRGKVLDTVRRVRDRGVAVVLISHNMPEVLAVSDRIEVLRLGRRVARFTAAQASVEDLVGAMTGAIVAEDTTAGDAAAGDVAAGDTGTGDGASGGPAGGSADGQAAGGGER
jgi:simple sugar transport system ATP-binding protein